MDVRMFDVEVWNLGGPFVPSIPQTEERHILGLPAAMKVAERKARSWREEFTPSCSVEVYLSEDQNNRDAHLYGRVTVDGLWNFAWKRVQRGKSIQPRVMRMEIRRIQERLKTPGRMHVSVVVMEDGKAPSGMQMPSNLGERLWCVPLEAEIERLQALIDHLKENPLQRGVRMPDPLTILVNDKEAA